MPYALKAVDADTIGGQPLSALVLSTNLDERLAGTAPAAKASELADESLVDSETFNTITVNNTVGIGTSVPVTALDFGASTDLSEMIRSSV